MKRKLALLLAGCLAISPAAAGYYPTQAFAAETGTESGSEGQVTLLVSVSDENGTALTEVSEEGAKNADAGQYSMTVGETRQLIASMEQEDAFPALSIWSSETPEIIDIDDYLEYENEYENGRFRFFCYKNGNNYELHLLQLK